MKASVMAMYSNGRYLSKPRKPVTGDLNLDKGACLINMNGFPLLNDLDNAVVEKIAKDGMLIRGTEHDNGQEFAQEWWVTNINKP
jgi:hypothetical protein